ncbi:MAG TPA: pyrrolidone-carboxylate peptidase, partial [Planctomycetota bacterium]|nr:pyrrolidone-carboxylate peptidase [Planctomycetota bacterium]
MLALVTGFGPFLDVDDNPSGAVARALDGARVGPFEVVGRELPVLFDAAPRAVDAALAELAP